MAGAAAHRDPHSGHEGLPPATRPLGRGRAAGDTSAEDATAEERPFQRAVAMDTAAAEAAHLPRREETGDRCAGRAEDAPAEIGLQAAERLARQDPEPDR